MPDDRVVPTEVMVTSHESPASAGIGAGEKIILAADCDAAQGTFGRFVVESQATVVEASDEGRPASLNVAEGDPLIPVGSNDRCPKRVDAVEKTQRRTPSA